MAGRSQRAELAPVHLPGLGTNAAVSGTNSISALVSGVVARPPPRWPKQCPAASGQEHGEHEHFEERAGGIDGGAS